MKRAMFTILSVILTIALLAACGGNAPAGTDDAATAASTSTTSPKSIASEGSSAADSESSPPAEGATAYNVGTSYAVDVPPELTTDAGAGETLNIYPQDHAWLLQLSTGYLGNKTTVEEFAAGWALTMEELTPCEIGEAQGYRYDWMSDEVVCTGVWFMFESLGDEGTPLATIYFKFPSASDADIRPLLDDPSVKFVLDSIRVPE